MSTNSVTRSRPAGIRFWPPAAPRRPAPSADYDLTRPTAIIMATVKGKGLSVAEGKLSSHNMPLSPEDVAAALQELQ